MAAVSLHECTQASLKNWQDDLAKLFQNAKERYPDVVWEVGEEPDDDEKATPDIDEIWGHKAIVYARAPPSFQTRYFQFRPSNTTSLSLALSDSFSRSPSPSRNPTPQPNGQGITRLRTVISTTLFSNELEYLYTGQGFGEAFQFLFDEDGTGITGETDSAEMRIDKLRRDLVFMWRSRLYSDVKIALSNEHEPSTAVFSTHKFILVSRASYFAKLLSVSPSNPKEESQTLTLPSPPYTPASLHFTLGYLYTGTLSFSHRTYDLSTALSILLTSSPSFLNLPPLHAEIRSRIVIEMAHGLFHAFLPFTEYDSLLNRGGTGGCKCRQCARRIPRILSFALQPTLQDPILERGARRALVGLFGDGWCTQEFAELDFKIRESVIRGVRKRMWKEFEGSSGNGSVKGKGLFALLFAAEAALAGKLTQDQRYNGNGQDEEMFDSESVNARKSWVTVVRNDILAARVSIDECLAECVEDCLSPPPSTTVSLFIPNAPDLESSSQLGGEEPEKEAEGLNEFHLLLLRSPHSPSYTDGLHLQFILSSLLRGLSHSNAPLVYQTLVSNVLLLPSVGDPEQSMQEFGALVGERRALLNETNYVRIQVEEARVEVMKWIKGKWKRVRDMGGFLLKGNTMRVPSTRNGDNHSLSPTKGSGEKDLEESEGKMELWAVQEIADYIQIPLDDLLVSPTTPVSAQPSSQSLHPVKSGKGDDASSVMSARSAVSARSAAPSFRSAAPSFKSGISTRSGALSPTGRRNGTGGSSISSARSGALSPTTRTRTMSPTMRVSTLSKNLPPAAQKKVASSSSSVRSFRSTTSVSTTTTTTPKSIRETPAKVDKESLGVRSPAGERPDSKFTDVEEDRAAQVPLPNVPDVVVGDVDMQDDTSSTTPSTSTSVFPHPSPSKVGQGTLTPKASLTSLSSNRSTQSNRTSSARSTSTSISPTQRRGSSHNTASVASTIRRAHAAAAKSSTSSKTLSTSGSRPVSSASTSTTASSVSGEYRTASAASGSVNRNLSGTTPTSTSQRKRTTSASSARSVSGVSVKSVGGASVRSVSSPRVARKSSTASAVSSRPPSVAASIRSKKEAAPPLPSLKKKGSSDTIKTIGGTVTRATASSAAKATSKPPTPTRKVTAPKTPEELRDPPPHLKGATLDIGIPCIVHVTLPAPPSSFTTNGSKMVGRKKFKALAKYIGQVEGEDGNWVGVEVPSTSVAFSASSAASPNSNTDVEMSDSGISIPPSGIKAQNPGWHDGSYQGIRYFTLSAPTAAFSNKKEQWGDADETPAGGYYLSSHKKFASTGVGTVRKRTEIEVGGTVGRNNKRLKTQNPGTATEKRGLFVRPQQVLYVVDALDGDDEL